MIEFTVQFLFLPTVDKTAINVQFHVLSAQINCIPHKRNGVLLATLPLCDFNGRLLKNDPYANTVNEKNGTVF